VVVDRKRQGAHAGGKKQHELELQRMIENLRSHPSIVTWVVLTKGGAGDTGEDYGGRSSFDPDAAGEQCERVDR